jgi:hypothetical protein
MTDKDIIERYKRALTKIKNIPNEAFGDRFEEIEEARSIAEKVLYEVEEDD